MLNIDLSNNEIFILNKNQIGLINRLINETTLTCLDISHILFGSIPAKYTKDSKNNTYKKSVNCIKTNLENKKQLYHRIYGEKISNKVCINKLKYIEDEEIIQDIKKNKNLTKIINEIIEQKEAIYPVFLIKKAKEITKIIVEKNEYKLFKDKAELADDISSENNKIFINNLANYMRLKKSEKELVNNYIELDSKKLILI